MQNTNNPRSQTEYPLTEETLATLLASLLHDSSLLTSTPRRQNPSTNAAISALELHPTLEAALHILNHDLPSAHFVVRKMDGPPAIEAMLLHAILHRVEGDFHNARLWIADVRDACDGWVPRRRAKQRLAPSTLHLLELPSCSDSFLEFVYGDATEGSGGSPERLLGDVEAVRKLGDCGDCGDWEDGLESVEERARSELERVVEWCRRKFGESRWEDARAAYAEGGVEVRNMGREMTTGEMGWQKF
ncbi:hypothetical protein CC78DRAFT_575560 [Lojkania enalia]|uniref:Uncharacterized protein n=1 Tax=Lojkania enalia TaxID=147567 RepID=A0A9P4N9C7_9PLEO|nr:hypothetical protein CC78DRAFT_575560 [Didymosphaeria enalia]